MKEIRTCGIRFEERSADNSTNFIIEGKPIVFDSETTINDTFGQYKEIIERGALNDCDLSDSRLLYNHDSNRLPLARTPKTMQFQIMSDGLHMRAELPNTEEGRSVHEAIKRGDLTGMSFAFKVPKGGDTYDEATNTRTIHKIEKVYEVSIVPFPAYSQTSVEARKMMEPREIAKKQALIKCNMILSKI